MSQSRAEGGLHSIVKMQYITTIDDAKDLLSILDKRGAEIIQKEIILKLKIKNLHNIYRGMVLANISTSEFLLDMINEVVIKLKDLINYIPIEWENLRVEFTSLIYLNLSLITLRPYRGDLFRKFAAANLIISILSEKFNLPKLREMSSIKTIEDIDYLNTNFTILNGISLAYQGACASVPTIDLKTSEDWLLTSFKIKTMIYIKLIEKVDLTQLQTMIKLSDKSFYTMIKEWCDVLSMTVYLMISTLGYFNFDWPQRLKKLNVSKKWCYCGVRDFIQNYQTKVKEFIDFIDSSTAVGIISKNIDPDDEYAFHQIKAYADNFGIIVDMLSMLTEPAKLNGRDFLDGSKSIDTKLLTKQFSKITRLLKSYEQLSTRKTFVLNGNFSILFQTGFRLLIFYKMLVACKEKDVSIFDNFLSNYNYLFVDPIKIDNPKLWYYAWLQRLIVIIECEKHTREVIENLFSELEDMEEKFQEFPRYYFTIMVQLAIFNKVKDKSFDLTYQLEIVENNISRFGFSHILPLLKSYKVYLINIFNGISEVPENLFLPRKSKFI